MSRFLALLFCFFLASTVHADEIIVDSAPLSSMGGLIIVRQGNQTTCAIGGGLFPRKVKVTTQAPDGPIVTRFTVPGNAQVSGSPFWPQAAAARLTVELPDNCSVLYIGRDKVASKGKTRLLESPVLQPGRSYPLHLRAAYIVGDNLLVEDKVLFIHAGENRSIIFDGGGARAVPLAAIK